MTGCSGYAVVPASYCHVIPTNIMNNEFILINPMPPEDLFNAICEISPDFKNYWEKVDNYFRNNDGLGTIHGIFAEYSGFIKANFENIEERNLITLFNFLEKCVNSDPNSESGISNAACTCFLENLAGEGELSKSILKYLGTKSKEYFDKYNS